MVVEVEEGFDDGMRVTGAVEVVVFVLMLEVVEVALICVCGIVREGIVGEFD